MSISDVASTIALLFSAFSLWQTSLKRSAFKVFVPPIIRYASPYQNSNFEAFAIPVTITNTGARTGTILSIGLVVKDPEHNLSKRFYSADLDQWSIEKARNGDFRPFAPISLPGRTSHTETVLFHARRDETVMQIVQAAGRYQFILTLDAALSDELGPLDRLWSRAPKPLTFEMVLPELDHRAFTSGSGTLPLHHKDWQSSVRAT